MSEHRHLIGLTSEQKAQFYSGRVRVHARSEVVSTRCGQLTLWWLANLLGRQFDVVRELEFVVADAPLLPGIALFGGETSIRGAMVTTVAMIADQKIAVVPQSTTPFDLELHVTPTYVAHADNEFAVWGTGWCCSAGVAIEAGPKDSDISVGPILAATMGAAEAFQRITNWSGEGRTARGTLYLSGWDGAPAASWNLLREGPQVGQLCIEPFYLCGAGAVGQALAATLSYFPDRVGHAVVIDGDPLDDTNFNRYCLAHKKSPTGKAAACKSVLQTPKFVVDDRDCFWEDYQKRPLPRSSSDELNGLEANYKYRLLVSCVDKNGPRHALQNFWPRLILGGSTSGLTAKTSLYDCFTGECLKCSNPLPRLPTIEEEAKNLRTMERAVRESVLAQLPPENRALVRSYLEEQICGHAAEQFLTELGEIRRREFSVGFVSVASGVFLAVALIQHALGSRALVSNNSNYFMFSFLSRKSRREFFGRDDACDCAGDGGRLFHQLWTGA